MLVRLPSTHLTVHARAGEAYHGVYEGEATMTPQQQDQYQAILGDQKARVSVGRDLTEKDFGSGGGIMVNVTLTCGQSKPEIEAAIALAQQMADGAAWYYQGQIKSKLLQAGILK